MAARRTLGGGRVLGSGRNLAPPPTSAQKQPNRNSGLLSPSESSVSLSSQSSNAQLASDIDDIASRAALGGQDGAQAVAAASNRMVCPICNEEMVQYIA